MKNVIKNQGEIDPNSIKNPSKIEPKSIKNPPKIDLGGVLGASWGLLGASGRLESFLGASWGRLGASWGRLEGVLVGNMAPTWFPKRSPDRSKIEAKINQFLDASYG